MSHTPQRSAWLRHASVARPWQTATPQPAAPPHPRPAGWRLAIAGALIALWIGMIYLETVERLAPRQAFPLGVALAFAFALIFARRPRRARLDTATWAARARRVAAVGAVGLLFRAAFLTFFPPLDGQLWEECQTGSVAEASLRDGGLDLYFPITNLLAESGFHLFGQTMLGLRLPFALLSIASIPLFYAAARALLRTFPAALAATALFAASAYLGAAGRVALESMAPIATLCAALAAAFHACRTRSLAGFALTGATGGLLLLEYTSYKLYAPLLFATVALSALGNPPAAFGLRRRAPRRAVLWYYRWHFAALAWACAAVIVPVFAQSPGETLPTLAEGITRERTLTPDGAAVAAWPTAGLRRVVTAGRQVFLGAGSTDLLPPTSGVVDPLTGVAGILALVWCAATARRDARRLFLVVAALLTVVFSGLLVDVAARYRITPLPPLLFLAIAIALDDLFAARPAADTLRSVAAALVAAVGAYNLYFLVSVAMVDPHVLAEFGDISLSMAREIAAAQREHPGEPVYIASETPVMHVSNDYSWLYSLAAVHDAQSRDDLLAATGTVVADGAFAAEVRGLPNARDCRESHRQLGHRPLHWIRCRLGEGTGG